MEAVESAEAPATTKSMSASSGTPALRSLHAILKCAPERTESNASFVCHDAITAFSCAVLAQAEVVEAVGCAETPATGNADRLYCKSLCAQFSRVLLREQKKMPHFCAMMQ
jgi:hypothetical protein